MFRGIKREIVFAVGKTIAVRIDLSTTGVKQLVVDWEVGMQNFVGKLISRCGCCNDIDLFGAQPCFGGDAYIDRLHLIFKNPLRASA